MNTETYKAALEAEKLLLESELGTMGRFDESTGTWQATPTEETAPEADESDMSDRTEDYEERSGTMTTLTARLADVETALRKIDAGTYGMCEACGNPIEADRLEANPSARTCKADMNKVS